MDKLYGYWRQAHQIGKRLYDYGDYCVRNDFLIWHATCEDFWLWLGIAAGSTLALLLGWVIRFFAKRWLAAWRERKRLQERMKVADEDTMRFYKWAGDDVRDKAQGKASAPELIAEIRKALGKSEQASTHNFYDVLGVPADATPREISEVCLRLAERYRPDKNPGDRMASQVFTKLENIYETLIDPAKRAAYDRQCKEEMQASGFPELKIV